MYYNMEVFEIIFLLLYHSKNSFLYHIYIIFIAYKNVILDDITNENNKDHDEKKWLYIPDHPYSALIIGGSRSGKANASLKQKDSDNVIDKIYSYGKDLNKPKYQCLKHLIKHLNDPKTFIEYSQCMDDVYNSIDYNRNQKIKILIAFDYMIADIMTNKTFQAIVKELIIRCRKLNIALVLITEPYFSAPREVILNYTNYLIMKNHNNREL